MRSKTFFSAGTLMLVLAGGLAQAKPLATTSDEQPGPTSPQGGSLATSPAPRRDEGTRPGRRGTGFSSDTPGPTSPQGGSLATNASPVPARQTQERRRAPATSAEEPSSTSPQGGSMLPSSR